MSLIPELVGKFFSKEKHIQIPDNAISEEVCYFEGTGCGELYPCFEKQCKYGKFHLDCLNLKIKPKKSGYVQVVDKNNYYLVRLQLTK